MVDTSNIEMIEGLQNDYSNIKIKIKDKDNDIERFSGAIDSFDVDMIDKYSDVLLNSRIIVCKLKVPKIYIRKIIGHQYRNLDSYKSKFDVQILYDTTLITDEIFPIQENTTIEIKGKESNGKTVVLNVKKYLYNLKVI